MNDAEKTIDGINKVTEKALETKESSLKILVDSGIKTIEEMMKDEAIEFGAFLLKYQRYEVIRKNYIWCDEIIGGNRYTTEELYKLFKQQK